MKWPILVLSTILSLSATAQEKRPNILFAFADDWGRYASAYGQLEPGGPNDLVKTPNFDRIAKEGVLFRNAFVTAPSCTPCRSSLLSGQYFWRTGQGAILQGAIWDSKIPSFPLLLEKAGYHIGYTAKVWTPGAPRDAPYGGTQNAYNRRGTKFSQFSQQVERASDIAEGKERLYKAVRGNFADFMASSTPCVIVILAAMCRFVRYWRSSRSTSADGRAPHLPRRRP